VKNNVSERHTFSIFREVNTDAGNQWCNVLGVTMAVRAAQKISWYIVTRMQYTDRDNWYLVTRVPHRQTVDIYVIRVQHRQRQLVSTLSECSTDRDSWYLGTRAQHRQRSWYLVIRVQQRDSWYPSPERSTQTETVDISLSGCSTQRQFISRRQSAAHRQLISRHQSASQRQRSWYLVIRVQHTESVDILSPECSTQRDVVDL
jgi:hypothetical protein